MAAKSPTSPRPDKEQDPVVGGNSNSNGNGDDAPPTPTPTTPRSHRRSAFFKNYTAFPLERTDTMITIGKLKLRGKTDDLPQ